MTKPGPLIAPTFDIVVLNHDYAAFLPDAIRSALTQSHPAAGVTVVDDGSSDDSRAVIHAYPGIDVVWKTRGGQASAINAGWRRSTADVVVFLDADDVLEPHALEALADAFGRHPNAARAHYPMTVIDAAGRPTGDRRPASGQRLPEGDLRERTLTSPFDGAWAALSGNAFARATLERLLPLPEGPPTGADWLLVHGASLYGPVITLDEPLARYRIHKANAYGAGPGGLDVARIQKAISYASDARALLHRHAVATGTPRAPLASLSDACNRLVSIRLAAATHPVAEDRRRTLLRVALNAVRLHADVPPSRRALMACWVVAAALAPRPFVPALARVFVRERPSRAPGSRPAQTPTRMKVR